MKDDFDRGMSPEEATARIREVAQGEYRLVLTGSVSRALVKGPLIMGDIRCVLSNGEVTAPAEKSSMDGIFKYLMECRTPNHPNSALKLVVIISKSNLIKVCAIL